METLYINGEKNNRPKIKFIPESGELSILGRAIIVQYEDFLTPMLDWAEEYVKNPAPKTVLTVDLEYFNTVAMKSMVRLMAFMLEKLGESFKIYWYYSDEDTYDTLLDFEETLGIEIKKIQKA